MIYRAVMLCLGFGCLIGYPAAAEERCAIMMGQPDGSTKAVADPNLHVIESTSRAGRFAYRLEKSAHAIMCGRFDIVPAANDYKIVAEGYTLGLTVPSADGGDRVGCWKFPKDGYAFE